MYKILIVEDDSIIAGTLKNHLCQWGFEVRYVKDFKNVLEETADFTPHLILLDIILPFFNGFHWCQRIQELQGADYFSVLSVGQYEYRHGDEYVERQLRKAL